MTNDRTIDQVKRDLCLARFASRWGDNSERIEALKKRLHELQEERERVWREHVTYVEHLDKRRESIETPFVALGMDENHEHACYISDETGKRTRFL